MIVHWFAGLVALYAAGVSWAPAESAEPRPVKKVYIMTDMEGVAGVMNSEHWLSPEIGTMRWGENC